jgi:hypothetical protein
MRLKRRPAAATKDASNEVHNLSVHVNHDKRGTLTIFRQTVENSRAVSQSSGAADRQPRPLTDRELKRTLC